MSELNARMNMHYKFTGQEFLHILVVALVMGFMLGLDDGLVDFEPMHWFVNLLIAIVISLVTILISITAQKAMALMKGYLMELKLFLWGAVGGVVIGLGSVGNVLIFPAFEFIFVHDEGLRLGRFRYGLNYFEMATCVMMGPIINFGIAVLVAGLAGPEPSLIALNIMKANVFFAISSMLPIPKTPGSYLFFGSPSLFFWVFAPITLGGILLFFMPFWTALLVGLVGGAAIAITYFFKVEYR